MNNTIDDLPLDNIKLDVTETDVNIKTQRIIQDGIDVTNVYQKGVVHGWQLAYQYIESEIDAKRRVELI